MADTWNTATFSALVRHQVALLRYSRRLRSQIVNAINRAEPGLRRLLLKRLNTAAARGFDRGPVTAARTRLYNAWLKSLADAITTNQAPAFTAIRALVTEQLVELARDEVAFTVAMLDREVSVNLGLAVPAPEALRSIVLSRPFQGRLLREWLAQYEFNDRQRMMHAVQTGMLAGETPTQVARRIFGTATFGGDDGERAITRRGAQTLAQTAMAHTTGAARQALYTANDDVIPRELYVATLDSRTTPQCRSLDGHIYEVGKGPQPPVHINCRSIRVPLLSAEAIGERPANAATDKALQGLRGKERRRAVEKLVGPVPAKTTYQQWLTAQPAAFQDTVLGPARGRLFRAGGLTLDKFVDASGAQYTLEELRKKYGEGFARAGL